MKIYFLTTSQFKADEMADYATRRELKAQYDLEITVVKHDVQEILHSNIEFLVRHKAVEAYAFIRHPCVVQHGGLFMDALPGLPGGVGKIVWDAVGDRMCGFLRHDDPRGAVVRSFLGYCDGRRVHVYQGETRGQIADRARGEYTFAWDPIFLPEGSALTYGEMGLEKKTETSPTVKAWDKFLEGERARFKKIK